MADFFEGLTGGSFGANARQADAQQAKLIYSNGTSLIARLRNVRPRISLASVVIGVAIVGSLLFLLLHPYGKNTPDDWISI
jgi:hypothetical protein